jgi:large subunit ribosomal protein L17
MRHRKANVKLGRTASHRKAMLCNMATSLFECEGKAIKTTISKAKALRPLVDKLVGLAKRGDLHARRLASAYIVKKSVLKALFEEAGTQYADRSCGYTSMVKTGFRAGDASTMVRLSLIGPDYQRAGKGKPKTRVAEDRSRRVAASRKAALDGPPAEEVSSLGPDLPNSPDSVADGPAQGQDSHVEASPEIQAEAALAQGESAGEAENSPPEGQDSPEDSPKDGE